MLGSTQQEAIVEIERNNLEVKVVGDLNRLVDLIQDINKEYDECVKRYNAECEKENENAKHRD